VRDVCACGRRVLFRKMTKETGAYVRRQFEQGNDINWMDAVRGGTITQGLRYSLATGNWGVQGDVNIKPGVAQALNRLTFASTLSHLRRVNCPTGREGKNPKPRQLHNSQWGVICPAETPEGHQVGLVKNLALMAQVTVGKRQEATDQLQHVLVEWATEEIAEINPTTIHNVRGCLGLRWGMHAAPCTAPLWWAVLNVAAASE
jgi:DNA-directed RNA polymerase II subunit RPB2